LPLAIQFTIQILSFHPPSQPFLLILGSLIDSLILLFSSLGLLFVTLVGLLARNLGLYPLLLGAPGSQFLNARILSCLHARVRSLLESYLVVVQVSLLPSLAFLLYPYIYPIFKLLATPM